MSATSRDIAVVRDRLPDDTLLVFVSDVHIGGADSRDIFESADELRDLTDDLAGHPGQVVLVLAGDFVDVLRLADTGSDEDAGDQVADALARPEYSELFASLRGFASVPKHRVVYLPGNHDAAVWSHPSVRRALKAAGFVDRFALSFAATFESRPDQLIYCEHGNQFDPANAFTDYSNPLDTPLGSHIVTEVVRPIGSGVPVTESIDLRNVSFVFPLMAIPEWIAGRIFYQTLARLLRWTLYLAIALVVFVGIATAVWGLDDSLRTGGTILVEAGYAVALLAFVFGLFFMLTRSATENAGRFWFKDPHGPAATHRHGRAERERSERAIRDALDTDRPLPLAENVSGREISVFVSGHTHAPSLALVERADGTAMIIANTGCWLRQLQPVKAWLDAPAVYVPAFVRTHVRVLLDDGGVTASSGTIRREQSGTCCGSSAPRSRGECRVSSPRAPDLCSSRGTRCHRAELD